MRSNQDRFDENNPVWKGDDVGYFALHSWVRRRLDKPMSCPKCGKTGWIELANLSGNYKRDLSDWKYLCRSCHDKMDMRVNNFKGVKSWSKKSPRVLANCPVCGKKISMNKSMINRNRGKFCSRLCSDKGRGKMDYAFKI